MNATEYNQIVRDIQWSWQDKGDLERACSYNEATLEKHFPHILAAWKAYKTAEMTMSILVRALEEKPE